MARPINASTMLVEQIIGHKRMSLIRSEPPPTMSVVGSSVRLCPARIFAPNSVPSSAKMQRSWGSFPAREISHRLYQRGARVVHPLGLLLPPVYQRPPISGGFHTR